MKKLLAAAFTGVVAFSAQAGDEGMGQPDMQHGVRIGWSIKSDATITGQHQNLYDLTNPLSPTSWKVEETGADAEIGNILSLGYNFRNYHGGGNLGYEFDASLNKLWIPSQTVTLDSKEGPFMIDSKQPKADAESLDLYGGVLYRFDTGTSYTPYIGAGLTYVIGRVHKTFYSLEDLLSGGEMYGQSGSSRFDGFAYGAKAGVSFDRFSVEAEFKRHDLHIDSFRSFSLDGGDLEYNRLMFNVVVGF